MPRRIVLCLSIFAIVLHCDSFAQSSSLRYSRFGQSSMCLTGDAVNVALVTGAAVSGRSRGNRTTAQHGKLHCSPCLVMTEAPGSAITSIKLLMDKAQGRPGDTVNISLRLESIEGLLTTGTFHAAIRFRRDVLYPLQLSPESHWYSADENMTIHVDSTLPDIPGAGRILATIPCLVLLGETDRTSIEFTAFEWSDARQSAVITSDIDLFSVNNGARFISNRRRPALIRAVQPNPARESIEIEIESFREDRIDLSLIDLFSRKIRTLLTMTAGVGRSSHRFSLAGLSSGTYFLLLQSSLGAVQQRIEVLR